MNTSILEVADLQVDIGQEPRVVHALQGVTFEVKRGSLTGLVGESGSGKSMTSLAILRSLPEGGRLAGGSIVFDGHDLVTVSEARMRDIRGKSISIFTGSILPFGHR